MKTLKALGEYTQYLYKSVGTTKASVLVNNAKAYFSCVNFIFSNTNNKTNSKITNKINNKIEKIYIVLNSEISNFLSLVQ